MNAASIPMRERLTRENLHGVWAAITTPFDDKGRFDEGIFRENLRRLHAAGVHGIYTTDSDGEFYAIELAEFKQIIDVFADETQRLGVPTQVGVTWCNTQGVIDRLQHAAARGILGAHVGHPFFMPMTDASLEVFWDDVARAVPETFALIHYNTPRASNYRYGPDYARLLRRVPGLVGTKHAGSNFPEFLTLASEAPELSHFVNETVLTPFSAFGARGVYSWFVNFNPRFMLDWYQEMAEGNWERARWRQRRLHAFRSAMEILEVGGNFHGIVGKAVSSCSSFLVPAKRTRPPYLPVPEEAVRQFRRRIEAEFTDLIWNG